MILIDTNILARYLLDDIPDHAERSRRLFEQAGRNETELFVPVTALAELLWLLIRQKGYPKGPVVETLLDLFRLPSLIVENHLAVNKALHLWVETSSLSFVDCYHLALAEALGMTQIYSFDKKMDRYPGVERIEPELPLVDE